MRFPFIMNPFAFFLIFAHIVISTPFPTTFSDLRTRGASNLPDSNDFNTRSDLVYNVFPSNVDNAKELSETSTYLQSVSDQYIERVRGPDSEDTFYWKVALKSSASTQVLKNHKGIQSFELEGTSLEDRSIHSRQDEPVYWQAFSTDPNNTAEVSQTREWLDKTVKNKTMICELKEIPEPSRDANWENRNTEGWYALLLDNAGAEEAKRQPGIRLIEKSEKQIDFGSTTAAIKQSSNHPSKRSSKHLSKRALEWIKSENAKEDLVEISKYKGNKAPFKEDFVYEKRAGSGVIIYVVDRGVGDVENGNSWAEFPFYDANEILATQAAGWKLNKYKDNNDDAHGTGVASKALGQTYGVAKEATLVSVVTIEYPVDAVQGFEEIAKDVQRRTKENGGQPPNCVIVCSTGSAGMTRENAVRSEVGRRYLRVIENLHKFGVPIVLASGNEDNESRRLINAMPQVLEHSEEVPLINVGASTKQGFNWPGTQIGGPTGPQLTIYAPGEQVAIQGKTSVSEAIRSGTSVAAPAVAGLIATYMNYDPPPWGVVEYNIDRVKAIAKYLKSEASSWERQPGILMIWNGADEAAHESVGNGPPDTCSSTSTKRETCDTPLRCYGITSPDGLSGIYTAQDTVSKLIDEDFCPAWSGPDKTEDYLYTTPDGVQISLIKPDQTDNVPVPSEEECRQHLHEIIDGCDNDLNANPMKWKGGGILTLGGWEYRFMASNPRPTPLQKPQAWCTIRDGKANVWGAGWLSADNGDQLRKAYDDKNGEIGGAAYSTDQWSFIYEYLDGHEWFASVPVVVSLIDMAAQTSEVIKRVAGIDVNCET